MNRHMFSDGHLHGRVMCMCHQSSDMWNVICMLVGPMDRKVPSRARHGRVVASNLVHMQRRCSTYIFLCTMCTRQNHWTGSFAEQLDQGASFAVQVSRHCRVLALKHCLTAFGFNMRCEKQQSNNQSDHYRIGNACRSARTTHWAKGWKCFVAGVFSQSESPLLSEPLHYPHFFSQCVRRPIPWWRFSRSGMRWA